MAYKAVFNDGSSLYHLNLNHDKFGRFTFGDGDHDGQTEYRDSLRRRADSQAARDRLDEYYTNVGKGAYKSSSRGPSGSNRSRNPYVDNEGNLTAAGQRRYEAEKRANAQKSKKNRVENEEDLKDPKKWVNDDINTMKDLAKANKDLNDATKKMVEEIFPDKKGERLDLSEMTDDEIRRLVNRERLERDYNSLFNEPQKNKGAEFVKKTLEVNSVITSQVIAGLTIAALVTKLVV